MNSSVHELARLVHASQHDRVQRWEETGCLPQKVLDVLVEAHHDQMPWSSFLLEYALTTFATKRVKRSCSAYIVQVHSALRRIWRAQGSPNAFADLDLSHLSSKALKPCRTVAFAVDEVLSMGQGDRRVMPVVQAFLSGRYIRSLGWANAAPQIDWEVLELIDRCSGAHGGPVPAEYLVVSRFLYGYREEPFASSLFFAASALMAEQGPGGERFSPATILSQMNGVGRMLRDIFLQHGLNTIDEFDADCHLSLYIASGNPAVDVTTRVQRVRDYLTCSHSQRKWSLTHPEAGRLYDRYRLPLPTETIDADDAVRNGNREQWKRREAQVRALLPNLLPMLDTVEKRALVFDGIHEAYRSALSVFLKNLNATVPFPFSVRLPDGSAILKFNLWRIGALVRADHLEELLGPDRAETEGEVITEFVGAETLEGTPLPAPFFVPVQRAWHSGQGREQLSGTQSTNEYRQTPPGLLRPSGGVSHLVTEYTERAVTYGREPRVLLDIDAVCTGMAYGVLAIVVAYATGMRANELLQLRADPDWTDMDEHGNLICGVYPKNGKRAKQSKTEHVIEAELVPYWTRLVALHEQRWGPLKVVLPERGAMAGLEAGRYIFQVDHKALGQKRLLKVMRFAAFGLELQTADGRPFTLASHLLRYGYARTRQQLEHPPEAIKAGLGHDSDTTAALYAGTRHRTEQPDIFAPFASGTLWEAMLPDAPRRKA